MDSMSWQAQLRKGAAELVVLCLLTKGESYGVSILGALGGQGGVLSDGTLYPLLTRLENDGKIEGRWVIEGDVKSPRKYYRLTPDGNAMVQEMRQIWLGFSRFVSEIVEGGIYDDAHERSRDLSAEIARSAIAAERP